MAETIEAFEMHEQPDYTYAVQGDRITFTENYGGGAKSLGETGATFRVGEEWSSITELPEDAEGIVVTGISFDRKVGSLGHIALNYSVILKREIWNVEWQEVSKDIRTWISSANCPNMVTGATAAKQLAYLAGWESLRDAKDWDNFANYKYPITSTDGNGEASVSYSVLPEPVLTVAHKIMKGVQSYSIFAPVVTRTTTHAFYPPASGNLGKKDTPVSGQDGWTSFNNETLDFSALANEWLKNVERSSSNGDGTFTLVEGWLGVDEVDGDLYQSAGTGA